MARRVPASLACVLALIGPLAAQEPEVISWRDVRQGTLDEMGNRRLNVRTGVEGEIRVRRRPDVRAGVEGKIRGVVRGKAGKRLAR